MPPPSFSLPADIDVTRVPLVIASLTGSRGAECAGERLDVGDEFVCRKCGIAREKQVLGQSASRAPAAIDFTGQALGGYLGPPDTGFEERFSRGLAGSTSTYRYLKLVSDYAGREDSTVYGCAKLIERVTEKLALPKVVMAQAVVMAKTLLGPKQCRGDVSTSAVSAYSIVTACRMMGVASANMKEVIEAHRLLGRRVKASSLNRLSLDSPFKAPSMRAEDYLGRVIGRLQSMAGPTRSLALAGIERAGYFGKLRSQADEVLRATDEVERGGHSPCSLAATAIYAAESELARMESRRKILTQGEVAESGGVAEYTVRDLYGRLFRRHQAPVPLVMSARSQALSRRR